MPELHSRPNRFRLLELCLAAVAAAWVTSASPLFPATFFVGAGVGCTHATLDAAFAAAAANAEPDLIRVADGGGVLAGLTEIVGDEIVLQGGIANCAPPHGSTVTIVQQNSGSGAFWLHGAAPAKLTLERMHLRIGVAGGRAVRIEGDGFVRLLDASLGRGSAPEGGNVWMSGANSRFAAEENSNVGAGQATTGRGGGIFCAGGGEILFVNSNLNGNTAHADGGGAYLDGCSMEWRSDGSGYEYGFSEVGENAAVEGKGGGIAAVGGAAIDFHGNSPANPLWVDYNASDFADGGDGGGGGIYLAGAGTTARLRNVKVFGNVSGGDGGGGILLEAGAELSMEVDPATCSDVRGCSALHGNIAYGGYGGAGLLVAAGGDAVLSQSQIYGNYTGSTTGGAAVAVTGIGSTVTIEGAEIFANDPGEAIPSLPGVESTRLFAGDGAALTIALSTLDEATSAASLGVVHDDNALSIRLLSSLVQADHTFHPAAPTATEVDCVITRENGTFPAGATFVTVVTDPALLFESPGSGYRLRRGSIAEDYCDDFIWAPLSGDIDGQERGWNDPTDPDLVGPIDVGADEWRLEIFADSFEGGDLLRWSGTQT